MPLGTKPTCFTCGTANANIWNRCTDGNTACNDCFAQNGAGINAEANKSGIESPTEGSKHSAGATAVDVVDKGEPVTDEADKLSGTGDVGPGTRSGYSSLQSSRGGRTGSKKSNRGRNKKVGLPSKTFSKGRGRRSLFKKQPSKAPIIVATTVTSGHLFHNDMFYQVGDIVSVIDEEGGIYYAQIRGLMQDQYCEKSAVLTWLIPTQSSPNPEDGFDPLTYILGPEEELPRKLDFLEFVMHAPNEYYKLDDNIRVSSENDAGYIWTSMGAVTRTIRS